MIAKLIHPITVKLKNINTGSSTYDAEFDEPTGAIVWQSELTLRAQVNFNRGQELEGVVPGFQTVGDGYLLMYRADAAQVDIGAMVTEIDSESVEHYVIKKTNAVHYDSAQMVSVFFETRDKGEDT